MKITNTTAMHPQDPSFQALSPPEALIPVSEPDKQLTRAEPGYNLPSVIIGKVIIIIVATFPFFKFYIASFSPECSLLGKSA